MGSPLQVLRRRLSSRRAPAAHAGSPGPTVDAAPASEPHLQAAPAPVPVPDPGRTEPATEVVVEDVIAQVTAVVEAQGAWAGVDVLRAARPAGAYPELDALELRLRHRAHAELPEQVGRDVWPPRAEDRFGEIAGCPEVQADELDAEQLASAVVNHGCLLVRGLVGPDDSARLVEVIDEAFRAWDTPRADENEAWRAAWRTPFEPDPPYPAPGQGHRGWVRSAGGVLAADAPPAFAVLMDSFSRARLPEVVGEYFGEAPVLSVDKCTLRRVPLDLGGAEWHQDGSFLGDGIRTLNIWVALTPCGGDLPSPGLDLVPRRFDSVLETGTDGAFFDWSVGSELVAREARDTPVIRPEFRAGDALLFDELFLHRTAIEPTMTDERYAIECWCFAGSSYPDGATPILF